MTFGYQRLYWHGAKRGRSVSLNFGPQKLLAPEDEVRL